MNDFSFIKAYYFESWKGVSKKKTRRKIFMGLGEGYNLEDSFIDDGDAVSRHVILSCQ